MTAQKRRRDAPSDGEMVGVFVETRIVSPSISLIVLPNAVCGVSKIIFLKIAPEIVATE